VNRLLKIGREGLTVGVPLVFDLLLDLDLDFDFPLDFDLVPY
jgi:hypothetical protein